MRLRAASIITPLLFFILTPAFAIETPRIVPRMQEIPKPVDEVFETLKKYFTDSSLSTFRLVSADRATHTLVARQSGIGEESWRKWAFCETGAVQMIYQFEDGAVTVTVKLDKSPRHSTLRNCVRRLPGHVMDSATMKTKSLAHRSSFSRTTCWPLRAPLPPSEPARFE